MSRRTYVLPPVTAAFFAVSSTVAGAMSPDPETGLIPVSLPSDLCSFQSGLPTDLMRQLSEHSEFDRWFLYMSENCPTLALQMADFATAAISGGIVTRDSDDDVGGPTVGNVTVADTAGDDDDDGAGVGDGTGTDGGDGTGGDGGASDGDDATETAEKNLPAWKVAKKNGIWKEKWDRKVARWEKQREDQDAWRAEKKANKNNPKGLPDWKLEKKYGGDDDAETGGKDLPDWKQAKKEERWEAEQAAAAEAQAAKKEAKQDASDSGVESEVEEDVADQEMASVAE
ncbi:MAG: hypothetical protein AAFQ79_18550 [Pseudomonadota bacterium]